MTKRSQAADPIAATAALDSVGRDKLLWMFRTMSLSRALEEALIKAAMSGKPVRIGHTYIGQEAVAVGVCGALRPTDYVTSTHRSHGHAIAKGVDPNAFMAELFGRVDGVCGGRAEEMAMADHSVGFMGSTEIVGGNAGMAVGLALGSKMQGLDRVTVCFFGDGATNQGILHESMNLAAIWKLPVIFVCDNNQYAESTPVEYALSVPSFADRAGAYGMPGVQVDGQDVVAVYDAMQPLIERARQGEGPSAVDAKTYRYFGHYYGDRHLRYRSEEEVEQYRKCDAIDTFRQRLLAAGLITDSELSAISDEVLAIAEAAVAFAEQSPVPEPEEVARGIYA